MGIAPVLIVIMDLQNSRAVVTESMRRDFPADFSVYLHEIQPEKLIKFFCVFRGMFVSVPPVPVAPLRNVQGFPGRINALPRVFPLKLRKRFPRLGEVVP